MSHYSPGWLYKPVSVDPERADRPKYHVTYTGKPHISSKDFDIFPDMKKKPGWKVVAANKDLHPDLQTFQRTKNLVSVARQITPGLRLVKVTFTSLNFSNYASLNFSNYDSLTPSIV